MSATREVQAVARAGAFTMVALCFANGLQGGELQTFAQSTEALKHTFHVTDFALGAVPFSMAIVGNLAAIPIAALCARYPRTRVLAGMFVVFAVLLGLTALTPAIAFGFVLFVALRALTSATEATDPAALPLIADYWAVEERSAKVAIFTAGATIGDFVGIGAAGVLVDTYGWRAAFAIWVPLGLIGAYLVGTRREPVRGVQDAAYGRRVGVIADDAPSRPPVESGDGPGGRWEIVRTIARLRTFRWAALGISATLVMSSAMDSWGIAYFKRTFGFDGAQAAEFTPVLGVGAFIGLLGGGFLADRILRNGHVRARVYVTALGYAGAGIFFLAAFTSADVWIAAPFLALGSLCAALPTGPQVAVLLDVAPAELRSQTSAATNVLYMLSSVGPLVVGALSTLLGNLRLALLCISPFYLVGAALLLVASPSYAADVSAVVADAQRQTE